MNRICYGCMKELSVDNAVCPHCHYESGLDDASSNLPEGTLLAKKYTVGRVLGHGGFGITYIAIEMETRRVLAIKEYFPSEYATRTIGETKVAKFSGEKAKRFEEGLSRFIKESKILEKYNDVVGIVSAVDVFKENATAYIVMEYIEGMSLEAYIQACGGTLDTDTAIGIMMPVMDSLREVHKSGLIHRDISPDNIYITIDGRVKLLDFGAAKQLTGEKSKSISVILKQGYAPEEQYRSKGKIGPWTDVYSVAATIYRMITGSVPVEPMERSIGTRLDRPTVMGIDMTDKQEKTLFKALEVKYTDRYQTIDGFQHTLLGMRKKVSLNFNANKYAIKERGKYRRVLAKYGVAVMTFMTLIVGVFVYNDSIVHNLPDDLVVSAQADVAGKKVDVIPDIRGLSNQEARFVLEEKGIVVKEVYDYSEAIEKNDVVSQSTVTSVLSENQLVVITVSNGSSEIVRFNDINLEERVKEVLELKEEEEIRRGDIVDIVSFDANELGIGDLTGMEYFRDLELLSLSGNRISNISVLKSLDKLKTLDLSSNSINTFKVNGAFDSLETLNLNGNTIPSLELSNSLNNLKTLDVRNNVLSKIEITNSLNETESFLFSNCYTEEFIASDSFANLVYIDGSSNKLTNIKAISDITNLKTIDFASNKVIELPDFGQMSNLESLDLSENNLTTVSFVSENKYMKELNLKGNDIDEIVSIEGMVNLKKLDLTLNKLKSVSTLQVLKQLEELKLNGNMINSSYGINKLDSLEYLDLSNNDLTIATYINNLSKLEELNLQGNQLKSTNGIGQMESLLTLNLSNNEIKTMYTMQGLTRIKELNLSNNLLPYIEKVSSLKSLESLDVSENMIKRFYDSSHYLDNLKYLNVSVNNPTYRQRMAYSYSYSYGYSTSNIVYDRINGSLDLSFLNEMDSIETVDLSYTNTKNLYYLKNVDTLKSVTLDGNDAFTSTNQNYVNDLVENGVTVSGFGRSVSSVIRDKGDDTYKFGGE